MRPSVEVLFLLFSAQVITVCLVSHGQVAGMTLGELLYGTMDDIINNRSRDPSENLTDLFTQQNYLEAFSVNLPHINSNDMVAYLYSTETILKWNSDRLERIHQGHTSKTKTRRASGSEPSATLTHNASEAQAQGQPPATTPNKPAVTPAPPIRKECFVGGLPISFPALIGIVLVDFMLAGCLLCLAKRRSDLEKELAEISEPPEHFTDSSSSLGSLLVLSSTSTPSKTPPSSSSSSSSSEEDAEKLERDAEEAAKREQERPEAKLTPVFAASPALSYPTGMIPSGYAPPSATTAAVSGLQGPKYASGLSNANTMVQPTIPVPPLPLQTATNAFIPLPSVPPPAMQASRARIRSQRRARALDPHSYKSYPQAF